MKFFVTGVLALVAAGAFLLLTSPFTKVQAPWQTSSEGPVEDSPGDAQDSDHDDVGLLAFLNAKPARAAGKGKPKPPKPGKKDATPAGWYDDFAAARKVAAAKDQLLFVVFRCGG